MKKWIAFALSVLMVLSLAACGQQEAPAPTAAPTVAATEAPTELAAGANPSSIQNCLSVAPIHMQRHLLRLHYKSHETAHSARHQSWSGFYPHCSCFRNLSFYCCRLSLTETHSCAVTPFDINAFTTRSTSKQGGWLQYPIQPLSSIASQTISTNFSITSIVMLPP